MSNQYPYHAIMAANYEQAQECLQCKIHQKNARDDQACTSIEQLHCQLQQERAYNVWLQAQLQQNCAIGLGLQVQLQQQCAISDGLQVQLQQQCAISDGLLGLLADETKKNRKTQMKQTTARESLKAEKTVGVVDLRPLRDVVPAAIVDEGLGGG
ncbi:hypothetical protein NLG97_g1193 [Lecanicillium saksenae]|uniref:Uncharacterized protein n=1 Tax=Lecanicillium saksenae TaxID=468837 RepID=A0ACC1R4G0_9HYPO|nr:hypothetical protein NLG97_g1193 [Lecanicillium saksenae]